MEKLKPEKVKHKHNKTECLKFIIFMVIMIAPFLAVLTSTCFAIFNEQSTTAYTGTIQNVFYESVAEISNQPLFNWTTSTLMYNTMSTMTTGLGITDTTIPLLLTYWALLTCIYVVFDIIIELFVKLTHFFTE